MKICHVITRLIIGGAQENTIFTVNGLCEKGYAVDLVSGPTEGPEGSLETHLAKDVKILVIKELIREISPLYDLIALYKLIRLFRKERYDIIHTHSAKAGVIGRIAAGIACRHTVVIHTIHGLSFHEFQARFINNIYIAAEKIAALFTDWFICVGEVMKEKSLEAGIGKRGQYSVVYSGFDVQTYLNADNDREDKRRSLGIEKKEKVIGMVGRLYHLKGQEYLMEAFADVVREYPDVKLLFVGDGILRERLERFAKEQDIYHKVIFTGLVAPTEIPGFISAMDILAHTSLREGLPKAVAQGFAGGKVVLAFDVDGSRELVVNDKTGYLIPPKDIKVLKEKILYLLKNPAISYKMGEEGRRMVESLFPIYKMVNSIEGIYLRLLEENGKQKEL